MQQPTNNMGVRTYVKSIEYNKHTYSKTNYTAQNRNILQHDKKHYNQAKMKYWKGFCSTYAVNGMQPKKRVLYGIDGRL